MDFYDVLDQVVSLLQQRDRVTYRTLKREFQLDDERLEDLKEELLFSHPEIVEGDGRGLVWNGDKERPAIAQVPDVVPPQPQSPAAYTPHHLAERILAEQAAMESRGSADGERKTITALFADLKGSTALIEGLDPEDARAIIDPALQLMMDAVHRYEGYVAQALGDGIFALFGAPIAHEDHPQRALYAALRMQDEMRVYSDQSRLTGGIPLQMRVGINTGEVVVRSIRKDDLHTDYVPVGHSTNLAARMEQLATPGSIVVTDYTRTLTAGFFEFKALGAVQIKGVEEPLNVYEVLGVGPLRTRFQVTARRGLTRFVSRHSELDHMQRALEQAKAGHGQIVGLLGEPGLGKSRLCYEFKRASQSGCLVLEASSVSYGKASPYLPLIELLKSYFQIEPTDGEQQRRAKVMGHVLALDKSLEDSLPYLLALIGIEDPDSSLHQMDAQVRRRRTFEALKRLFFRESLNQPLILIFEDLHWIDTETQGFLDTLSESVASAQLLLLVNYRPEYRHAWGQKTYYTQLRLAPLGQAEAEELLTFLLGSDTSLTALQALILERTDGTPFFLEEIVQTLAEEGVLLGERGHYRVETTPFELHISPTVQGVLAARVDRLAPDEKELLQQLAVIGRQFPTSLLRQVVVQPEAELHQILASLQAKEFLYEQPAFPEVEYLFKHALTQEVAYGMLLQERRKELHERAGQASEALYKENLEDHFSELAYHYSRSDNTHKAVEYLSLAGQQAARRSAHVEAITHLSLALELLTTCPQTPERAQQELDLHTVLGPALMATKGFAAPEVEKVYTRARELCQQVGETPQLFTVLWCLWQFYHVRAQLQTAHELGEQLLQLAQNLHDPSLLLEAHLALGNTLEVLGDLVAARGHLEQGEALYDPQLHHAHVFRYGSEPGVYCKGLGAYVLWELGYPDQARQKIDHALTLAHEFAHPHSLGFALYFDAFVHLLCREVAAAQERVEAVLTLSSDLGFLQWVAWGTIVRGWALAEQGHTAAGIAQIRAGLAAGQATGTGLLQPRFYGLLAEACGKDGQTEEGLGLLAEALALITTSDEHEGEAELYRLKGELLLNDERRMMNDERKTGQARTIQHTEEAEACFLKAIEVAREQQAKSWELRAATSLARLWQQQGKTAEARDLLAPVYNWFTEGFDTADLKDAKALLENL